MICAKCKAAVPAGRTKCPRCGALIVIEMPALLVMIRDRPWLIALLTTSVLLTLWLATRRAPPPPPEPIPAAEPVAAPAPEPEPEPEVMPALAPIAEPAPEPVAATPEPKKIVDEPPPPLESTSSRELQPDGTWR